MRALVVDDSAVMRRILKRMLEKLEFEIAEAPNGQIALECLTSDEPFNLVLVDWNMPVMNGIEFVTAARALSEHDDVRILLVTSQSEIESVQEAVAAGADEYLMKPFTEDSLLWKLNSLGITDAKEAC